MSGNLHERIQRLAEAHSQRETNLLQMLGPENSEREHHARLVTTALLRGYIFRKDQWKVLSGQDKQLIQRLAMRFMPYYLSQIHSLMPSVLGCKDLPFKLNNMLDCVAIADFCLFNLFFNETPQRLQVATISFFTMIISLNLRMILYLKK